MIKKKLTFLIAVIFISLPLCQINLHAAEISAGATTWYAWWDFDNQDSAGEDNEYGPEFLYGPAISVKFSDDYNFTFVFLYGKFDMDDSENEEIKRYDSDLALNYRLNSYFKIFAGGKYMAYKSGSGFDHSGYGPGAGLSAVLPLGGNIFILGNISGLYLWGEEKSSGNETLKYNEYGMNSGLSLAYYINAASVTLSLGGRYQYFKTVPESSDNGSEIAHQFYGITASATYSFNL